MDIFYTIGYFFLFHSFILAKEKLSLQVTDICRIPVARVENWLHSNNSMVIWGRKKPSFTIFECRALTAFIRLYIFTVATRGKPLVRMAIFSRSA